MLNRIFKLAFATHMFSAACVMACLLSGSAQAARLYSWVDGEGVMHLSSTPPKKKMHNFKMHKVKGSGTPVSKFVSEEKTPVVDNMKSNKLVEKPVARIAKRPASVKRPARKRRSLRGDPDIEAYMQALRKKESAETFRLLYSGAEPDQEVLGYAVATGQSEIVAELLAMRKSDDTLKFIDGANHGTGFESLLTVAIRRGHQNLVELLLKKGAKPSNGSADRHSDLEYAITRKQKVVVKLLIDGNADVNANGARALQLAVQQNNSDLAELLLKAGAKAEVIKTLTDDATKQMPVTHAGFDQDPRMAALLQKYAVADSIGSFEPFYNEIVVLE